MSNSNSDNPKIGKAFQEKVQNWFAKNRNENYVLEYPIHIGKPARPHNFDVANKSGNASVPKSFVVFVAFVIINGISYSSFSSFNIILAFSISKFIPSVSGYIVKGSFVK